MLLWTYIELFFNCTMLRFANIYVKRIWMNEWSLAAAAYLRNVQCHRDLIRNLIHDLWPFDLIFLAQLVADMD